MAKKRYVVTLVVEADVHNGDELYRVHEEVRERLDVKAWGVGKANSALISMKVEGEQMDPGTLGQMFRDWKADPIYDLYDMPNVQAHRYELMAMQRGQETKWANEKLEKVTEAFSLLRAAGLLGKEQ